MKIEDVIVSNGVAPVELPYFPMRWQAFIWRNWGLVPTAVLAKVLCASESQIEEDAREIGLPEHLAVSPKWRTHGYQTLIRRNWHILPMTQLLELLQWTPEQMAYTLKEEDFLGGKLGSAKPECKKLIRREPSAEEHRKTAELKAVFRRHFDESELSCLEQPFAFADKYAPVETANGSDLFEFNFIHSYAASCGDVFGSAESSEPVPENLLAQYASMGIKGIWMHALLYLLCPIPGAEEFSIGYEKRLGNLRKVIECCARYGIKVYLYLNEPRYMPLAFYDKKPLWGGVKLTNSKTICITRTPEPLEWLEHAMKTVFSAAPGLGGVFSITMSENATHCNYDMQGDKCPSCSKVKPQEIIARIITAMERGMHAAAPEVKMIAFDWAWRKDAEYRESADFKNAVVNLLPKSVYILSVSEWGMLTHIGNVEQYLIDYSISQVGPSEETLKTWKHAREIGLKIAAKIQINNSWELSAVPYIPTPYLIQEHLKKLRQAGVDGLMLSWTLGGFPGGNLELLSAEPETIAASKYHSELAEKVCKAWKLFSEAFRQFPFNVYVLYDAPMNYGPMNLLCLQKTGYTATMIGYPYDDLETWRGPYPEEILEKQFQLLTEEWKKGLDLLREATHLVKENERTDFDELTRISTATYDHLRSTFLQIRFVRARNHGFDRVRMTECALEEIVLAKELASIVRKDSRIGFEASNHLLYAE